MRVSAIVLLSGGLDSATTLAIARAAGRDVLALTFRYGQRHHIELEAARRVASACGVREHLFFDLDPRAFGFSALTTSRPVPKDRELDSGEIPDTYAPARNTIFLAYALAVAEVHAAEEIYLGVNALDYSGYPDCRPEYIAVFERLAGLATKRGVEGRPVRVCAPLIDLTKKQIVQRGLELGVDFGLTRSCYDPDGGGRACGHCDSCRLRLAAFAELGLRDPAPYVPGEGERAGRVSG